MIGCYDFCGHYEWTFAWLERQGGEAAVRDYWRTAIAGDSQQHASELIRSKGFAGMARYWGHTLAEESPEHGFTIARSPSVFRIDLHDCPSKGFLVRNGLAQYHDYCDHCIGWIGPMMHAAGFKIDHEHNHRGQCWWEFRPTDDADSAAPPTGAFDVRLLARWDGAGDIDRFIGAGDPPVKQPPIQ
jgi:hypothetical protein